LPTKTPLTINPYAKTKSESQTGEHAKIQTHPSNREQAAEDLAGEVPGHQVVNYQPHFDDEFMVRFLRRRGFTVLPLTQCTVSASYSLINESHVVLVSQLFRRNEATWGVIFGGMYYHNFDFYTLDPLSFLNKPVLSAYVISSPLWQLDQLPPPKPTPVPKAKMGKLTLRDLMNSGLVLKIIPDKT
jgi:hypothetical protein